jgi:CheY-like chemotaxis protein
MEHQLALNGCKVLVLEDELIISFALEDMLVDLGAEVLVANSLAEAQAKAAEAELSLAVLDVNVHGIKSYDFAEQLAERGVPLIFATGYGDAEHPPQFAGTQTLTKPYSRQQLVQALAAAR